MFPFYLLLRQPADLLRMSLDVNNWTPWTIATPVTSLLFISLVCQAIYRLFFHPLAKVPGPRLAALTHLYEFYYDAVLQGRYVFEVEEMHKKYGPIVRVNPREVHIKDPDFFDEFYGSSRKLDKDGYFYRFTASQDAAFGTPSFSVHRQRRKAFNRFFSTAAVSNREANIRKCVLQLCSRLEENRNSGKPIYFAAAFRALATDVSSQYALPQGFNLVKEKDFGDDFTNLNRQLSSLTVYHRHFPFILTTLMSIPEWMQRLTASPGMLAMLDFQSHNRAQAHAIAESPKQDSDSILHGICNSDLPASDKTPMRIFQEAITFVGAGSETAGSALEHITFHLLANPSILSRLRSELTTAAEQGDLTSNATLKTLPYLEACIKEGLRLGNEVSGRLPRIDPSDSVTYKSYTLPPGTVISMTLSDMHLDPSCHDEPLKYNPDRFLDPVVVEKTEKYFAPWNKGSRSCVGREMAMVEMRMTLALLVHRFELTMVDTTEADVGMAHDLFSPFKPDHSKGLQVLIS